MSQEGMKKRYKLSKTSSLHYIKLVGRSLMLLGALALFVADKVTGTDRFFGSAANNGVLLFAIWAVYVVEMILRFFPSSIESMGCQKQFSKNYIPTGKEYDKSAETSTATVILIAFIWLVFNGIFALLYYLGVFDRGIMILISLAFGVCDMICILFFCPFQTWIMKNKCCTSCRIYNWDFAMMFTPLVFVPDIFCQSLFMLGMILLIKWEIYASKYPERFSETTNKCLSCGQCKEKLCTHKRQLKGFLQKNRSRFRLKDNLRFIQEKVTHKKISK